MHGQAAPAQPILAPTQPIVAPKQPSEPCTDYTACRWAVCYQPPGQGQLVRPFFVAATQDLFQRAALQRLQIIKDWVAREGVSRERVIEVAGATSDNDINHTIDYNINSVNLATCEPGSSGPAKCCAVWSDPEFDPEFDPELDTYYYA